MPSCNKDCSWVIVMGDAGRILQLLPFDSKSIIRLSGKVIVCPPIKSCLRALLKSLSELESNVSWFARTCRLPNNITRPSWIRPPSTSGNSRACNVEQLSQTWGKVRGQITTPMNYFRTKMRESAGQLFHSRERGISSCESWVSLDCKVWISSSFGGRS